MGESGASAAPAVTVEYSSAPTGPAGSPAPKGGAKDPAATSVPMGNTAPQQIVNINIGSGSPLFTNESGPGDLSANQIEHSNKVRLDAQNEAIRTGDISSVAKGDGVRAPFEIEGSEQDQNEM
jgi:hypothetical protein